MKTLPFIILMTVTCFCFAQRQATIEKTDFEINSVGKPEIHVSMTISIPDGQEIDDDALDSLNPNLKVHLKDENGEDIEGGTVGLGVRPGRRIVFSISDLTQEQFKRFSTDGQNYFISVNNDVNISTTPGEEKFFIAKQDVKANSIMKMQLGESSLEEILDKMGGPIYGIQNMIDFGISPVKETETGKSEYYLKYGYRDSYTIARTRFFFFSEGLISTNSDDSLNFINVYPVNYKIAGGQNEFVGQLGIEGNQRFTNGRASAIFYWQGLTPNLVDLTMGENRLRLRPVLKLGVKAYQEFDNTRRTESGAQQDNEFSGQLFTELYYYIPIKKVYSVIMQGNAFYDLNKTVNPDNEIMFNYSITIGLEIPKTPLKTIFKYVAGVNGINYEYDSVLVLGLMADLFSFQE